MKDLITQYEKKVEKFDYKYFLDRKQYQIASALSALLATISITNAYYEEEGNLTEDEYILRLYALLQGLFVSVDALYSLAYSLTNSKNFININNNPHMRNLRYVRNNVVGHPANRIIGVKEVAYCILDMNRVSKNFFTYNIYTKDNIKTVTIDINELVSSFFKESNTLLDELYNISLKSLNSAPLKTAITQTLDGYYRNGHFVENLNKFIDAYVKEYPKAKKEQHRILWRYELILKLDAISNKNQNLTDVIDYCIGLELNKIYKLIYGKDYKHRADFELPSMILSLYRFFNRNPEFIPYINHLKDSDDPLFFESLKAVYEGASLKKMQGAMDYLGFLITLFMGNAWDMIYAIALPISEYKKKK